MSEAPVEIEARNAHRTKLEMHVSFRTKEPNVLDWVVYRLFRWRWNPIFRDNPELSALFEQCLASGRCETIRRWRDELYKKNHAKAAWDARERRGA